MWYIDVASIKETEMGAWEWQCAKDLEYQAKKCYSDPESSEGW